MKLFSINILYKGESEASLLKVTVFNMVRTAPELLMSSSEDLIVFQDPKIISERLRPVQHKLLPTRHCPRLHHIHLQDSCGENSNRIPPVGRLHTICSDQLNRELSCRSRRQNICAMFLFGGTVLLQLRSATMSIHQE